MNIPQVEIIVINTSEEELSFQEDIMDRPQTFEGMKDISYCPMCGQRLEKKKLV